MSDTWCGVGHPSLSSVNVCREPTGHNGPHMARDSTGRPEYVWGEGVWVAFNWDGSAFVPFASELEAYRYAAGYHMNVKFVAFGDDEWMRR